MSGYNRLNDFEVRPKQPVQESEKSCPTRLMDGRNELRCWLLAGHEGDCK